MLTHISTLLKYSFRNVSEFRNDNRGAVAIIAAFAIPFLVLFSLVTIDFSLTQASRTQVQASLDSAILAASVNTRGVDDLNDEAAVKKLLEENFLAFVEANLKNSDIVTIGKDAISYDPSTKRVEATITFNKPSLVAMFNGETPPTYSVSASTHLSQPEKNALSMFLVLDKSGSMGWNNRMPALKQAVGQLSNQLVKEDPDELYTRVGAVAYDSRQYWRYVRPAWGPKKANDYTRSLRANGGTNSSRAMRTAYQNLRGKREEREHAKRNTGTLQRVIVFMTDGANNASRYDKTTLHYCNQAKKQNIAIYTVAFQAPTRGQALLKACATSGSHYFEADDADDLIRAFELIGESAAQLLAIAS